MGKVIDNEFWKGVGGFYFITHMFPFVIYEYLIAFLRIGMISITEYLIMTV